jgi:hypothetical protein
MPHRTATLNASLPAPIGVPASLLVLVLITSPTGAGRGFV